MHHGIREVEYASSGGLSFTLTSDPTAGHFFNRSVRGDEFLDATGQHYHVALEAELVIETASRPSQLINAMRTRQMVTATGSTSDGQAITWGVPTVPDVYRLPTSTKAGRRVTWRITLKSTGHTSSQITPVE